MNKPKINIFVGHYGSGKTEMAINFALKSADNSEKTTLVDIDIVNPFFRSSEVSSILEENNIDLISPNFVQTNLDIPSLPATISGVFHKENEVVIFDVGGDPEGARVLGSYKQYLDKADYNMYFVINTRRPFTNTAEEIIEMIDEIEAYSRQKITHLVSNTNLSYETTMPIVEEGIKVVEEVSKITNIPIAYINIPMELDNEFPKKYEDKKFLMKLYMAPWYHK